MLKINPRHIVRAKNPFYKVLKSFVTSARVPFGSEKLDAGALCCFCEIGSDNYHPRLSLGHTEGETKQQISYLEWVTAIFLGLDK